MYRGQDIVVGYIPKEITIFKRDDCLVNDINDKEIGVLAAVAATDNSNDMRIKRISMTYAKYINGKRIKNKAPNEETRANAPIKNLKVYDYHGFSQRSGTMYNVMTEDGFGIELREEILMSIMLREGVGKGGVLSGEFIFARVGAHTQLILCGSDFHKKLIKATEEKSFKKIKNNELVPGQIYHSRSGLRALFLGFVSVPEVRAKAIYEQDDVLTSWVSGNRISRYVIVEESVTKPRKRMLWFVLYGMKDGKTPDDIIKKAQLHILNPTEDSKQVLHGFFDRFEFRTIYSYIVAEGPAKGTKMGLPEIKKMSEVVDNVLESSWHMASAFRLATMCKYGDKFSPPEKFKKYFEKKVKK